MRVRRPQYGPFPSMDPFMTALAAALSLQDKAQQYGSYAGIAAVFGLGVLSLLYFAQAREVKRLREWAGRAPERAAELEARAVAAADERRAAGSDDVVPAPATATAAAAVAAGNGTGVAAPPEVAPVPGVPTSAPDKPARWPGAPASVPAAAVAAATAAGAREAATALVPGGPGGGAPSSAGGSTATVAAPAPAIAPGGPPASGAGGSRPGAPAVAAAGAPVNGAPGGPAPATAAARGGQRPPSPLRASGASATMPPPRTAAGAARARGGGPSGRSRRGSLIGYTALVVAVAAIAIFAVLHFVVGGDDNKPAAKPNTVAPPASAGRTTSTANASNGATGAAKVNRGKVRVAVLNGTTFTGLARSASDKLTKAGFQPGTVTNDTTNQQRSATAVFYADGQKNAALEVAKIIGIGRDAVQQLDANTRGVAGQDADVVVSVGADQAR